MKRVMRFFGYQPIQTIKNWEDGNIKNTQLKENCLEVEIKGSCGIRISKSCNFSCGGILGFSIDHTKHETWLCGGVMSKEDALLLADFIKNNSK